MTTKPSNDIKLVPFSKAGFWLGLLVSIAIMSSLLAWKVAGLDGFGNLFAFSVWFWAVASVAMLFGSIDQHCPAPWWAKTARRLVSISTLLIAIYFGEFLLGSLWLFWMVSAIGLAGVSERKYAEQEAAKSVAKA